MIAPPIVLFCFMDYWLRARRGSISERVRWLSRVARIHARWINLKIRIHGSPPPCGLIVSNHISYLDIIGLSVAARCAFVSKAEVKKWPLFGTYAKLGGTIFLDRERRSAVAGVAEQMQNHLAAKVPLVFFPEGTSTDGTGVFPFRTSLFDPVVKLGCKVTACGLRYSVENGSVTNDVAYWGDMVLLPHFLGVIRKRVIHLDIYFDAPEHYEGDRKSVAHSLQKKVCELAGLVSHSAGE